MEFGTCKSDNVGEGISGSPGSRNTMSGQCTDESTMYYLQKKFLNHMLRFVYKDKTPEHKDINSKS